MEVSGQRHASAALSPGKKPPGTHWVGSWMGLRADLDAVVNTYHHHNLLSLILGTSSLEPVVNPTIQAS
jgi:hypothetical protein